MAADMGITIPKHRRTAPKHSRAITANEQEFCDAPPSATPSSRSPAEPNARRIDRHANVASAAVASAMSAVTISAAGPLVRTSPADCPA
jgi:hypothetical protein